MSVTPDAPERSRDDCVFCRIVAGKERSDILWEEDECLVFLPLAALNAGHLLVAPRAHYSSILAVPDHLRGRLMDLGARLGGAVMRAVEADGFNLLIDNGPCAGQVVRHACMHVIPRFPTDGLVFPRRAVPPPDEGLLEKIRAQIERRLSE